MAPGMHPTLACHVHGPPNLWPQGAARRGPRGRGRAGRQAGRQAGAQELVIGDRWFPSVQAAWLHVAALKRRLLNTPIDESDPDFKSVLPA